MHSAGTQHTHCFNQCSLQVNPKQCKSTNHFWPHTDRGPTCRINPVKLGNNKPPPCAEDRSSGPRSQGTQVSLMSAEKKRGGCSLKEVPHGFTFRLAGDVEQPSDGPAAPDGPHNPVICNSTAPSHHVLVTLQLLGTPHCSGQHLGSRATVRLPNTGPNQ